MSDPTTIESKAYEVTFFEDRAEVVRQASFSCPAGRSRVILTGATPLLDDSSVRVESRDPGVRVPSVLVRRQVKQEPAATQEALEGLRAEEKAVRREYTEAHQAVERTHKQEARVRRLLSQWAVRLSLVPKGERETLEHWHHAYRTLESAHYKILDRRDQAQRAVETHRLAWMGVQLRLQLAQVVHPRIEATVEAYLVADHDTDTSLVMRYRTPCAAWRPEHRACLRPPSDKQGDRLELSTWGTIWQATGETWENVRCRLSTARPAQEASAPMLEDDVLTLQPRSEPATVVEARDQEIMAASLSYGIRKVSDMPGVDDGGEPLVFEAVRPASIVSDGRPLRVELERTELPAMVDRVAWPERTEGVFVRALATWTASHPLLAGPVRLVGGEASVGVGRIGFVGTGEPFELGFGLDDRMRVRRQVVRSRETVPVIGTQKVTVKIEDTISNLSKDSLRVVVIERVPVSELGDVKVVPRTEGGSLDGKDGLVRYDITLAPHEVKSIMIEYRVEAGARVQLPASLG